MKPVNNHLLIEPVKHESFISASRETYEEIGVVIDFDPIINNDNPLKISEFNNVKKGDKVFFDSWLASKYPNGKDGYFWLVKWSDVRAIDNG